MPPLVLSCLLLLDVQESTGVKTRVTLTRAMIIMSRLLIVMEFVQVINAIVPVVSKGFSRLKIQDLRELIVSPATYTTPQRVEKAFSEVNSTGQRQS